MEAVIVGIGSSDVANGKPVVEKRRRKVDRQISVQAVVSVMYNDSLVYTFDLYMFGAI